VRRRQFLSATTAVAAAPLLGTTHSTGNDPGHLLVARLENVVHQPPPAHAAMPADQVRKGMLAAKADFQASRYRQLAQRLPVLLATADASVDSALLAELNNTATHVLIKLKVGGSGWITAERALTAARASGDPAVIANVTCNAATLYRNAGRYDLAEDLALAPLNNSRSPDQAPRPSMCRCTGCCCAMPPTPPRRRATAAEPRNSSTTPTRPQPGSVVTATPTGPPSAHQRHLAPHQRRHRPRRCRHRHRLRRPRAIRGHPHPRTPLPLLGRRCPRVPAMEQTRPLLPGTPYRRTPRSGGGS
jgi:hypothetical protein